MALKVSTGFTRKLGLPDYCSVGASCQVEFELDASLLNDLEAFHEKVRDAYIAAAQAVQDELARHQEKQALVSTNASANGHRTAPPEHSTSGVPVGSGSGNGNGRPATEKQLQFIGNLVRSIRGLGSGKLEQLSKQMFGKPIGDITSFEASALIDQLKAVKSGDIDVTAALGGSHG